MTNMNNNIKLNFLHVCDYASLDRDGKLNILGIFKNISVAKIPSVHPQLFIVTNITVFKHGSFKEIIRIVDDKDNEIIMPLKFNLIFPSSKKKKQAELGVIARVNNLRLSKTGNYKVQVYIDKRLIGETSITVSELR